MKSMVNLEFSVPYNNDPETLKEILRLKKHNKNSIREIYLSGPHQYSGSGRRSPEIKIDELIQVVDKIHKEGIRINLIFNPTCEGSDWYSTDIVASKMEYIRKLHEEHGVEAITIANPIYIKEVRKRFPDMEICASVLGDIDCLQRAILYKKAGANVITPDININRNLKLLKKIKEATNTELRLMVNEGCLYKCPFRKFHFNYTSHRSKELEFNGDDSFADFLSECLSVFSNDHSQVLKSCWIRPEDVSKYSEITSFFKIVGRNMPKSMVVRTTKAYLEESWGGDLLDLMAASLKRFSLAYGAYLDNKGLGEEKFFEKVTSCDRNCNQCNYCLELAKKLIKLRVLTREKMEDLRFK